MKKTYKNIDYEWLTKPTGDPFVDAGGYALEKFSSIFPDDDILQLIMRVTDIYVDRWKAKINSFFFDSKITNPSISINKKAEENVKYFKSILNDEGGHKGCCRITGRQCTVFPARRDNMVLAGAGKLINFNSCFQSGLMVSKEVIIRNFFLPFACEQIQGRIGLVSSNSPGITRYICQAICQECLNAIDSNSSVGVLQAKSGTPGTALFRYTDKLMHHLKIEFDETNDSISLYHFSNGFSKKERNPGVTVYQLPFQVLRFYSFVHKAKYEKDWTDFVNAHYYYQASGGWGIVGSEYKNKEYVITLTKSKKERTSNFDVQDFQYWGNTIYNNLLNGKSLTRAFLKYTKMHSFNLTIIKTYETRINNMKKETIEKIEQMADFIINSNDENGISKAINKLSQAKYAYELRRFVIKDIISKNYEKGNENAIITVRDYTEYLFPDTDSWREIRDVLLISIFEKLHQLHKNVPVKEDGDNE